MRYELYYWPGIQGRGEFVRLALEDAGADYLDIARQDEADGGGVPALERFLDGEDVARPPFAPPFLKAGRLLIGQTANILLYLGPRLGLAPASDAGRLWTQQLQLTIADAVVEAHDSHHPVGAGLYYEDQREEAERRAREFVATRIPKFLGWFERVLARSGGRWLTGRSLTYADLSLFQLVAGLRYAFPRAMAAGEGDWPRVIELAERVAARPCLAAYLASDRRLAFNEHGIFRHYPELDRAQGD